MDKSPNSPDTNPDQPLFWPLKSKWTHCFSSMSNTMRFKTMCFGCFEFWDAVGGGVISMVMAHGNFEAQSLCTGVIMRCCV